MQTEIIYEDKELLVIYKPSGLATQSARITQVDVVSELNNYLSMQSKTKGTQPYLGLIHRLDQPVEGLLVFAKTKEAAANLSRQVSPQEQGTGSKGQQDKICKKVYLAVVYLGDLQQDSSPVQRSTVERSTALENVVLEDYLIKDSKSNLAKIVTAKTLHAKKAVLSYEILAQKEDCACVRVTLETGRFHQIRVQMAHANMPLLGDLKYGSAASIAKSKEMQVRTVALCASELTFLHPKTNKQMTQIIKPKNPVFTGLI